MNKWCENSNCWRLFEATNDDVCQECLSETEWAESLDESNNLLPSTTITCKNESPQFHTEAMFQSFSCEPPTNPIPTTWESNELVGYTLLDEPASFSTVDGETALAAIAQDPKQSMQGGLSQPSPPATLPFHYYNPQAGNTGKDKNKRSCTSCYNKRKCITEEGQLCCKYCVGKSVYCKGPVYAPQLIETQSWSSTAAAAPANASMSLDAVLSKESIFCLEVSLDQSRPSPQRASTETERPILDAIPVLKSYVVDLQGLRDNTPTSGDVLKLDEILDMIFPDVKSPVSNISNADPDSLISFECHCRRFLACIMPLRIPKSCMLGSRLWKDPASSYVMFEFLRQLSVKACALFGKIFEDLNTFLNSPRNKKQYSKQISFVAFNLGLVHKGIDSLGRGQEEWSQLLKLPNPYVVAFSALTQLKFLGKGFNPVSFVQGCDDEPTTLPSIYITLALGVGKSTSEATDKRYSFIEVLAHCTSLADGEADEKSSNPDLTENVTKEQQNLKDEIPREISELRMQIQAERKRHEARMTELETKCLAKSRFFEDLNLVNVNASYTSVQVQKTRQIRYWKHPGREKSTMYSTPQPSPSSETATLVEAEDASSIEDTVNTTSTDAKIGLDTATYHAQFPDEEPSDKTRSKVSYPKALVKDLVPHRHYKDFTPDQTFPNSMNLSKRKRLPGYLSLKKQRLAAGPTIQYKEENAIDKTSIVHLTNPNLNLANSPRGFRATGVARPRKFNNHKEQNDKRDDKLDEKQENSKTTTTNGQAHLLGQTLRNRPSWILAGMEIATQGKKIACIDTVDQILLTDSDRPTSWPRSRRWRKSFGVSVKALTDGFEKLTTI